MPWAQAAKLNFFLSYGSGNCSCHLGCAPCSSCTHEGNPHNLAEDPYAWGEVHVVMAEEAKESLARFVDGLVNYHMAAMRLAWSEYKQ